MVKVLELSILKYLLWGRGIGGIRTHLFFAIFNRLVISAIRDKIYKDVYFILYKYIKMYRYPGTYTESNKMDQ